MASDPEYFNEELVQFPLPVQRGQIVFCIDIGGTLTKLAYADGDDVRCGGSNAAVRLMTFNNGNLKNVLGYLRNKVWKLQGRDVTIIGTAIGVGGRTQQGYIESELKVSLKKCDEFQCNGHYVHYCITNMKEEDYLYPYKDPEVEGLEKDDSDKKFPLVFGQLGSGVGYIMVEEDGKTTFIGGGDLGGLYFYSMGTLLTKCKSYEELLDMANKGDLKGISVMLDEVVKDTYGGLDASIYPFPITAYPFGRVIREGVTEPKKEDVAAALMDTIARSILATGIQKVKELKLSYIYFGGTFLSNNEFMKNYFDRIPYAARFMRYKQIKSRIFKYESYPGVLGGVIRSLQELSNQE